MAEKPRIQIYDWWLTGAVQMDCSSCKERKDCMLIGKGGGACWDCYWGNLPKEAVTDADVGQSTFYYTITSDSGFVHPVSEGVGKLSVLKRFWSWLWPVREDIWVTPQMREERRLEDLRAHVSLCGPVGL